MNAKRSFILITFLVFLALRTPTVRADTSLFTLTAGTNVVTFTLPTTSPSHFGAFVRADNVMVNFNGLITPDQVNIECCNATTLTIQAYNSDGICTVGVSGCGSFLFGPAFFSVAPSSFTFLPGSYSLTGYVDDLTPPGTPWNLTITSVPEPPGFLLLLTGMAAVVLLGLIKANA